MRELTINFLLNAVISYIIATLVFLVGAEIGIASVASAAVAGVFSGIAIATTYQIGKMKCGGTFDFKAFGIQVLAAIIFGALGGIQMGL